MKSYARVRKQANVDGNGIRPARREPHARADHHLLGDVHLIETLREFLLELFAERRVAHVRVERHDPRVERAETRERGAVRLARGHAVAQLVRRGRHVGPRRGRRLPALRLRDGTDQLLHRVSSDRLILRFERLDRRVRLLALLERLAVPRILVFDAGNAVALERARQDHRGTPGDRPRLGVGVEQRVHVVPVDNDGVPPEGAPFGRVLLHVVLPHRRAALAQAIDVGDPHEVVDGVKRGRLRRFPDGAFSGFAIPEQHVRAVVGTDAPRIQGDPHARAEALAERPGGDIDEGQPRRRVPLEIGAQLAQLQQLAPGEQADRRPRGVQERRRVPLGEHEAIVVLVLRLLRVEPHLGHEERRHDVGSRRTGGRVAAACRGRREHRVDAELSGNVVEHGDEGRAIRRHGRPPKTRV